MKQVEFTFWFIGKNKKVQEEKEVKEVKSFALPDLFINGSNNRSRSLAVLENREDDIVEVEEEKKALNIQQKLSNWVSISKDPTKDSESLKRKHSMILRDKERQSYAEDDDEEERTEAKKFVFEVKKVIEVDLDLQKNALSQDDEEAVQTDHRDLSKYSLTFYPTKKPTWAQHVCSKQSSQ